MNKPVSWSYSSMSLFQQCPQKYYRLRIAADVKNPTSHAMSYGLEAHKIAEEYIRDGKAIPKTHHYMKAMLDNLRNLEGEKLCEQKLGLTEDLQPCDFSAKNVWWRGIADLLILQNDVARVVDYKTGKSAYADTKQLELIALAVFKHHPAVQTVKSALLFTVHNDFVTAQYERAKEEELWVKWRQEADRLAASIANNVWNPTKNFTCRNWCPVSDCPHNGRY